MGLLPPTLLVGVVVLFVHSRVRNIYRPFARLFYGIPYLAEPSQAHIRKYLGETEIAGSSANTGPKKKKKPAKDGPRSLPMALKLIDESFFSAFERKFLFEFEQCLAVFTAFLAVYIVEFAFQLFSSRNLFEMAHHLALGTIIVCVISLGGILLHLGFGSIESKLAAFAAVFSILVALLSTAPSKGKPLLNFGLEDGIAYGSTLLKGWIEAKELPLRPTILKDVERSIRVVLAILLGLITASFLVPAIRYSKWLFQFYVKSEGEVDGGEQSEQKTSKQKIWKAVVMAALVMDAVLPLVAGALFVTPLVDDLISSTQKQLENIVFTRLLLIALASILRLSLFRVRIRDYLSTALILAQKTLSSDAAVNPADLEQKVFTIHYYAPALGLQYIAPALCSLVSSLIALKFISYPHDPFKLACFQMIAFWSSTSWGLFYLVGLVAERSMDMLAPEARLKRA